MPEDPAHLRREVKGALRERMHALRRALPAAARQERSRLACETLMRLGCYQESRVIALYSAFDHELDTTSLLEAAWSEPKTVALPRLNRHTHTISFHAVRDHKALSKSPLGIAEPQEDSPTMDLTAVDIVVVPALAADARGHRIGYGHGHYDRVLARMPTATRICLIYDFQLLVELPDEGHDERAHVVLTDQRVLDLRARDGRVRS